MFDLVGIFSWFKKNFTRRDSLIILLITAVYFLSRLINLENFPIFTDEGIYIRWAKVAWHDSNWRFISLTDGKQPLQTWGTIPFLKLFPENPLLAGRLFSVSTGFASLVGIFSILHYLWGKKAAYFGSTFYLLTPYFLFYDRLALVDSGVNAGAIWILFLSILLARTLRLDVALLAGLVSGVALLAKSSSQLFIGLAALSPILFFEKNLKKFYLKLLNFGFLYIVIVLIGFILYNVQRLSPFMHYVAEKNKTFVMTFSEFFHTPFLVFFSNLKLIPWYTFSESGYILPILGIIGLGFLFKKDWRLALYLTLWIAIPFFAIAFFAKTLFPRYLIFFISLFLITTTYLLTITKNKSIKYLFLILFIVSISYFDYTVIFDQKNIPFPPVDRGQYIESKNAGWGVKEIIDFARQKSQEKPVILMAEGNFGLVGDMLDASLKQTDKNIHVQGYWPLNEEDIFKARTLLDKNYVYVVFSHRNSFPEHWPIKLVKKYDKPGNQSAFYLFKLVKSL